MQSSMATANGFDCSKSFSRNLVKILKLKMHCSHSLSDWHISCHVIVRIERIDRTGSELSEDVRNCQLQMWLVLCGGVWHSSQPGLLQSTCFDSSTRATLMPPAVIRLWRNQQQFLCSLSKLSIEGVCQAICIEQHHRRVCVCVYSKSDCNCMSNTTPR